MPENKVDEVFKRWSPARAATNQRHYPRRQTFEGRT